MESKRAELDVFHAEVGRLILSRQHPATGLIPASVAKTTHGDYRDAWVRDNVYSILAVWALALAYRRLDDHAGKAYELEHATVKCMRGLLVCMISQTAKIEQFKTTQSLMDCLHAKYSTATGATVVGDNDWGHLQLDATSLFLLYLAQMTLSGLHIIFTLEEVAVVQNLVFYIERAYRTPDYGIWERGNKINHGQAELNCSSVGMVVAALQAINGINLFGSRGGPSSVIHVMPDEIIRNYATLHSSLPRESASKEIDAALLSVISFPAFAVTDPLLIEATRSEIIKKLAGKYGCKRFLRDGHQTVLENSSRLHYDPRELTQFEGVESEWPLFYTYLILDGQFRRDHEQVEKYRKLLANVVVDSADFDMKLVPELYVVPIESIDAEKKNPGSQKRLPNENVPLIWAQSLYILGNLIYDRHLDVTDIDPLGLHSNSMRHVTHVDTVVQIVLLSESSELQSKLRMYGLETQTAEDAYPIIISQPSALRDVYSHLGANKKLGLTGRPLRPIGTLTTSKIYKCQGTLYAFLPHFMNREEFYLVSDPDYLVTLFEHEVAFVKKNWKSNGRPTMIVMLTSQMLGRIEPPIRRGTTSPVVAGQNAANKSFKTWKFSPVSSRRNLLNFMMSLASSGVCNGTRVRVGRISEMVNTACIESLDFIATSRDDSKSYDWNKILAGCGNPPLHSLLDDLSVSGPDESLVSPRRRNRSVHKSTASDEHLKSPLTKHLILLPDFKLRDHIDSTGPPRLEIVENKRCESPDKIRSSVFVAENSVTPDIDEANEVQGCLNLRLGDPRKVAEACSCLVESSNIHDQADLLHYLVSTVGSDYEPPGLVKISELLEEVYLKAMQLKEWSVVRQTAGLLKKTVNSLASHISDLIIRQKPTTVGIRPKEYIMHTPKNPQELSDIIFSNCASDPREAPLVQEVITYLASFIRSSPNLFDGIVRVRTHFFVIAMREEISRTVKCDEIQAIEYLMEMSPFEMKSLMRQVLTSGETQAPTPAGLNPIDDYYSPLGSTPDLGFNLASEVVISAQSAGYNAGNFAKFSLLRDGIMQPFLFIFGRGLNVILIDPIEGSIIELYHYDTNISKSESEEFARRIEYLEDGIIVVLVSKDDFCENISESAKRACESIGSKLIRKCQYRDSWCCIGIKGSDQSPVTLIAESHNWALVGPSEIVVHKINLAAVRSRFPINSSIDKLYETSMLPSGGRWIRRRKNDGALNRIPKNFYPKIWRILEKTKGIRVGSYEILSDVINESTPEETNFALQVENILDNFSDPAERQLAVESLVVISNEDLKLNIQSKIIDLTLLIRTAVSSLWVLWVKKNKEKIEDLNFSFVHNIDLAYRVFFDLDQTGHLGTMEYLSTAFFDVYLREDPEASLDDVTNSYVHLGLDLTPDTILER